MEKYAFIKQNSQIFEIFQAFSISYSEIVLFEAFEMFIVSYVSNNKSSFPFIKIYEYI